MWVEVIIGEEERRHAENEQMCKGECVTIFADDESNFISSHQLKINKLRSARTTKAWKPRHNMNQS
jgi:hypothetical protein